MSYCANIRTTKKLEPQSLFKALAEQGEQIVVTSPEFPCLKFGTFKYALRGVEVNEEENGYEVRICSMGSMADYQLFPKVVCAVQNLTNGEVFDDEDDEKPLKDPKKRFGLKWHRERTEASWNVTCALINHHHEPIIMQGLFAPFVIGKNILNAYTIDIEHPTEGEDYKRLEYLFFTNQWQLKDLISTDTDLVLNNPKNREQNLRLSLITSKNNKVCDFDYIHYADLVCVMNQDTNDFAMARFKYLGNILPADKFRRIDELQFVRTAELTLEDFMDMLNKTKQYQEDDFFAKSSWKGNRFIGDIQYVTSFNHQLAIPAEFDRSKEGAMIGDAKAPSYLLWDDDACLLFDISPCIENEVISDKEQAIVDFRSHLEKMYGLIEVEGGKTQNGQPYLYSLLKVKEENGVAYHLTMMVQMDNDIVTIACIGLEGGVTGQRDAVVFELESRKNNVKLTENGVEGWTRDPYDETITEGFLMNLSEQIEYDSMFPTHPLSLLRECARFIIEHN